jgi:hypothetical protein
MARQQAETRQQATELGITSSVALYEQLALENATLQQLESEESCLAIEISEKQDALVEAKGRLPELEELVRRHTEASSCRGLLAEVCPTWAALSDADSLVQAAGAGRPPCANIT